MIPFCRYPGLESEHGAWKFGNIDRLIVIHVEFFGTGEAQGYQKHSKVALRDLSQLSRHAAVGTCLGHRI